MYVCFASMRNDIETVMGHRLESFWQMMAAKFKVYMAGYAVDICCWIMCNDELVKLLYFFYQI